MINQGQFDNHDFKKSSVCPQCSSCIEVAHKDGIIAVRDNKNLQTAPLLFNKEEWVAFIAGVKNGEFDF